MIINMANALARFGDDRVLMNSVIDMFYEDAPKALDAAQDHLAKVNLNEASRAAHSLKGLCANFDAMKPATTIQAFEGLLEAGNLDEATALLGRIREDIAQVIVELKAWQAETQ
jgi:HPt (histidine-containing phosphotransfer) domain-containing protein